ncbi:MAG TPA: NADH-quinone oxidoreductase subunit NuoH [Blastocatellia bacterium]|nr:NADH-quinone oxidoreductase subunit NuoH [Blastocatellia bacterium]
MTNLLLEWVIKTLVILLILVTAVAYVTLMERKVMAWIQMRVGPNRVGLGKFHLWGLMQPLADGLKMIFKEDIVPLQASHWLYILAPALSLIPALMTFIVIPYGSQITLFDHTIELHVTRMNVGLLYVLALTSVGVYGIVLAGWSSNNKYSLMGGLRSSAQMISYELALGLSIVSVLLYTGTLDLVEIVDAQRGFHGLAWNIFHYPLLILVFIIFYIASLAETNRTPFDLPEADSELVAGYHTEYSSMKFVMFQMAEYLNLITASSISTTLFFGGWNGPFVGRLPLLGPVYFTAKVLALIFTAMWIRYTVPRFRYDQLMRFGWKFLLPASIVNIIISSTVILFMR